MGILKTLYEVNCNDCKNVSLTEEEQKDLRENHYCTVYGARVFHKDFHINPNPFPRLFPCRGCVEEGFVNFKEREKDNGKTIRFS